MRDVEQVVTKTEANGTDSQGDRIQQQTKRVQTTASVSPKVTAINGVWYVLGFIEILLAFRFALRLFGANTGSGFVDFIYSVTNILTAPFDSIFGVTRTAAGQTNSVFEPSIIVAGIVYALIAWGIVKLLTLNQRS
jgi:hypothetical protein